MYSREGVIVNPTTHKDRAIIKNKHLLTTTRLRSVALDIVEAGISKVPPSNTITNSVRYHSESTTLTVDNTSFKVKGRIFVIGGGKASGLMAEALEKLFFLESDLSNWLKSTVIKENKGHSY